jgi:Tc5 transposase DNA-binding domain
MLVVVATGGYAFFSTTAKLRSDHHRFFHLNVNTLSSVKSHYTMPNKYRSKIAEKEKRIQEALAYLKQHRKASIKSVAEAFNVPRTPLGARAKGRIGRRDIRENPPALSLSEEYELLGWISRLSGDDFPPKRALVREMAEIIRRWRVGGVNDRSIQRASDAQLGREWVTNFVHRYPQLHIDKDEIESTSKEDLDRWFTAYESEVIHGNNIKSENIYNMDEFGFSIGTIKNGKIIIDKSIRSNYRAEPGRREWVTVIDCICADGTSISPYIIFKGQSVNSK